MNFVLDRNQTGPIRVRFTIGKDRITVHPYTADDDLHRIIHAMLVAGDRAIDDMKLGSGATNENMDP